MPDRSIEWFWLTQNGVLFLTSHRLGGMLTPWENSGTGASTAQKTPIAVAVPLRDRSEMPTSLRIGPYRFFFYAGDASEPPNMHVQRDRSECKFWLAPVRLAWNRGFSDAELRRIERITEEYEAELMEIWNGFFDING